MNPNEGSVNSLEAQDKQIESVLGKIEHRIVVFSGKGGVGKTTVAVNLAYALLQQNRTVGLMDADITGPNVPKMTGADIPPVMSGNQGQMHPQFKDGLKMISIAPMLPGDSPVIWRGPLRSGAIRQFLADVEWGTLDYLLADLPPGTGDEVLTAAQTMLPQLPVVVTTPQEVSLIDCRRAVNMAKKLNIPQIAVIENMAGLICPHCREPIDIFGSGGGERMASEMHVDFLGRIPMELAVREGSDQGRPIVLDHADSAVSKAFLEIAGKVVRLMSGS